MQAALEQGLWPLAVVVLLGSLLALIYVWEVVETAYLQPPPEGRTFGEAPLSMLLPTWALVLANLYFGIDAKLTAGVAIRRSWTAAICTGRASTTCWPKNRLGN